MNKQSKIKELLQKLAPKLYPLGVEDQAIWQRAGGDLSLISPRATGKSQWFEAIRLLENGGGGDSIDFESLLENMKDDFPKNKALRPSINNTTPFNGQIELPTDSTELVKYHLENGNVQAALEIMIKVKPDDAEWKNKVLLLRSRYTILVKDATNNVITRDQKNAETNRLTRDILDALE